MNQNHAVKTGIRAGNRTIKLVMTGMLACLAFVLNTFVYFPSMAPFQHFVDVLAAVFLGPWYGCASALLCGVMRMMSGRTIQAVTGAGRTVIQENKKSLPGLRGRGDWHRASGSDGVLPADEMVLWPGRSVAFLLYPLLYALGGDRSRHGTGGSPDA